MEKWGGGKRIQVSKKQITLLQLLSHFCQAQFKQAIAIAIELSLSIIINSYPTPDTTRHHPKKYPNNIFRQDGALQFKKKYAQMI